MGYFIDFRGSFTVSPRLEREQVAQLREFAETRHTKQTPNPYHPSLTVEAVADGVPGIWCNWIPSNDGSELAARKADKFPEYIPWLNHLIEHYLTPWGRTLSGRVMWRGEDFSDIGVIAITPSGEAGGWRPFDEHSPDYTDANLGPAMPEETAFDLLRLCSTSKPADCVVAESITGLAHFALSVLESHGHNVPPPAELFPDGAESDFTPLARFIEEHEPRGLFS